MRRDQTENDEIAEEGATPSTPPARVYRRLRCTLCGHQSGGFIPETDHTRPARCRSFGTAPGVSCGGEMEELWRGKL
jgi:hypothetical protein